MAEKLRSHQQVTQTTASKTTKMKQKSPPSPEVAGGGQRGGKHSKRPTGNRAAHILLVSLGAFLSGQLILSYSSQASGSSKWFPQVAEGKFHFRPLTRSLFVGCA